VVVDLEDFLQQRRRAAGVRRRGRCALDVQKIGQERGSGKRRSYQRVQVNEADLVVKCAESRCSDAQ
jgi:hypothetical protein